MRALAVTADDRDNQKEEKQDQSTGCEWGVFFIDFWQISQPTTSSNTREDEKKDNGEDRILTLASASAEVIDPVETGHCELAIEIGRDREREGRRGEERGRGGDSWWSWELGKGKR